MQFDRRWVTKVRRPLARAFFDRDPQVAGPELLGKVLLRREGRRFLAGRIVEVEAYLGTDDPAAHSASGRTPRNAVLFGPPGLVYVYFIYGNHYCLNVSCLPEHVAGGILFRALEPLIGDRRDGPQPRRGRRIAPRPEKAVCWSRTFSRGLRYHPDAGTTKKLDQVRAPTYGGR